MGPDLQAHLSLPHAFFCLRELGSVMLAKGVAKAPRQRQAWSSEVGRGPSLSNQPHGADDCVDPALGGGEGGTGQARPATFSSLQNACVSVC